MLIRATRMYPKTKLLSKDTLQKKKNNYGFEKGKILYFSNLRDNSHTHVLMDFHYYYNLQLFHLRWSVQLDNTGLKTFASNLFDMKEA